MSNSCCPTDVKPVVNNYQGKGKTVTIDGHFDMYVAGGKTSSGMAIVEIYDVFGATPHSKQFADRLSEALGGCVVCVPDFIGDPWDPQNVPASKDGKFPEGVEPADGVDVLVNWIINHHNTRLDRTDSFAAVKDYLVKEYSITKLGVVGMCWGAKMAFTIYGKKPDLMDAIASCHGSFLEVSDVENVPVPLCLLNSKDEPESYTTEIGAIVLAKSSKNIVKKYPKMHHGWMGTRGIGSDTDFQNPEVVQGFQEGICDLASFFLESLKG